jgi:ATPase subunit of ABC transporter with duplicated ATPase domains
VEGGGRRVHAEWTNTAPAAHASEQKFESLSGGQQARFQILLLELSGANLLLFG